MSTDRDSMDYASIKLTHHVAALERDERSKRRSRARSVRPECIVVGHAWTEEPGREGGAICLACQVVRFA